jgi:hypothetical protein
VLVVAFVEGLLRPADGERRLHRRAARERRRLVTIRANHGELAVIEVHDALGMAHERGGIGCDEHLALADP